jgi:3-hydroxy-5-methyl-1-naphthoate 3-O-methyltransferase
MVTTSRAKFLSPTPLMEMVFSIAVFNTLSSSLEFDIFTRLSGTKGTTSEELARSLGIAERPAEVLLTGCAALGLLVKKNGLYRNSPLAEEFLVRGKSYYFGGILEMWDKRLYLAWHKLAEAVRTNRPTAWNPDKQQSLFDGADPLMMSHFWEGMHSISTSTAHALGKAVDLRRFRNLLDVGGGSGAMDIELCRQYRNLRARVYDLPSVVEIASGKISQGGMADRIGTVVGNFFADATYPAGHDLILLSMIMHDWSEEDDRQILRKCYDALPSGGAVVICELLVNDEKTGPAAAALMSLTMLIDTRDGRNYTAQEYASWLKDTGFRKIRTIRFKAPGADGAVIGEKP